MRFALRSTETHFLPDGDLDRAREKCGEPLVRGFEEPGALVGLRVRSR